MKCPITLRIRFVVMVTESCDLTRTVAALSACLHDKFIFVRVASVE